MIALDTNLLVYAHREDSPHHLAAAQALRAAVAAPGGCAIPWPCVHEFLAVVTHPRIYDPPTPVATALFGTSGAWLHKTLPDPLARAIGSSSIQPFGTMATLFFGALAAGFCLTKLHARPKTTLGLVACTIALSAAVLIIYVAIAFVGCIAALAKHPI